MNSIIQSLFDRKSVRAFESKEIAMEIKQQILRAAMEAPTAGNQQLYTILDITDQGLKDRLAVSCDNQPFIAKAPLVLIFCADCQKWYDAFLEGGCTPRDPGQGDHRGPEQPAERNARPRQGRGEGPDATQQPGRNVGND